MISIRQVVEQDAAGQEPISVGAIARKYGVLTLRQLNAAVAIDRLYRRLGGPYGPMGSPTDKLSQVADDTFISNFDLGHIKVQGNDPPVSSSRYTVRVYLAAIKCFGTDDPDGTDEAYAVASVFNPDASNPNSSDAVHTQLIGPQEIQRHDVFGKEVLLGEFSPTGIGVNAHIAVFDKESGNPDQVRDDIDKFLRDQATKVASAIAGAVSSGDVDTEGVVGDILNNDVTRYLTLGLGKLIAGAVADDFLGEQQYFIAKSEIANLDSDELVAESLLKGPDGLPADSLPVDVRFNYPKDYDSDSRLCKGYKPYLLVTTQLIPAPPGP